MVLEKPLGEVFDQSVLPSQAKLRNCPASGPLYSATTIRVLFGGIAGFTVNVAVRVVLL